MLVSNWGNYPKSESSVSSFATVNELIDIIKANPEIIARGLGRCYGDSALSSNILSTLKFNRFISFDNETGLLTCESGVSLKEIINVFLPRGWFLPTTPGTKFITVGGAIASDVHGKNHHVSGSFSNQVVSMDVLLSNGEIVTCSKENNSELFWTTCGGMGLTGIILRAAFKLVRVETSYINQEAIKAENLDEIMKIFEESRAFTYSVAWIDCLAKGKSLGRSIMMRGEHASKDDLAQTSYKNKPLVVNKGIKLDIPFDFPNFALNPFSVKAFNFLYYNKQLKKRKKALISYDTFFYPLDSLDNWNRIYGKRGFLQYQFVLPMETSCEGLKEILTKISSSNQGSFLAVLKLFGQQNDFISFPMEGYTLALDFPLTSNLFSLLDELDKLVLNYGGRLYLTKDARMKAAMFDEGYQNSGRFRELKHIFDTDNKFVSLQSKRLSI